MQRRRISAWHSQGHQKLDEYGIPRAADGLPYTIAERIGLLVDSLEGASGGKQMTGGRDG